MTANSGANAATWVVRTGVAMPPMIYFISMLGFWFGLSITSLHVFAGFIACLFIMGLWCFRDSGSSQLWKVGMGVLISGLYIAVLASIQSLIPDGSYDGQQYHAEAIAQLSYGFNPVREMLLPNTWEVGYRGVWLNTLANYTWVVGSVIYNFTDDISSTKILPLYYMAYIAMYVFILAPKSVNRYWALFLGFAVAFNPVVISQMFTNYIDGVAYLTVAIAFLSLVDAIINYRKSLLIQAALFALAALSVKLTSLMPIAAFWIFMLIASKWVRSQVLDFKVIGGLAVVSFLVFYAPYMTNTLHFGNPLYPLHNDVLFGVNSDYPENFAPAGLFDWLYEFNYHPYLSLPRPVSFMMSQFSVAYNGTEMSSIKMPFVIHPDEFKVFVQSDVRINGFGPLFSAELVLTAVMLFFIGYDKAMPRYAIIVAMLLYVTAMFTPHGWWARYVGYLWLAPILVLFASIISDSKFRTINYLAGLVIVINVIGISIVQVREAYASHNYYMNAFIPMLKRENKDGRPWLMNCDFTAAMIRLQEHGIRFVCNRTSPAVIDVLKEGQSAEIKVLVEQAYLSYEHRYCPLYFQDQINECHKFFRKVRELKSDLDNRDLFALSDLYRNSLTYDRKYMW